jgi:hypothetical protein
MPLAERIVLTPAARLRYVKGSFSGYSETGSAQNLTVASRTVQNIEERIELGLSRIEALRSHGLMNTTFTFGLLGLQRLGDATVNTTLIGQNLAFATPGKDSVGGFYAGVGMGYWPTERIGVFLAVEGTHMSDKSVTGIAKSSVRMTF